MVDFQSRDTRRGLDDEDDESDDGPGDDPGEESGGDGTESAGHEQDAAPPADDHPDSDAVTGGREPDHGDGDGADERVADDDPAGEPDGEPGGDPLRADTGSDRGRGEAVEPDRSGEHAHGHGHDRDDHGHDHDRDDHGHGHDRDDHGHGHDRDDRGDHGHDHDHGHGLDVDLLGVAVVTVSSTRSLEEDPSGDVIQAVVEGDDHEVTTRELVRDDFDSVQSTVKNLVGRDDVDAVITTGGTGVTPDDVTIEAVRGLFDKTLPGFGELFRLLSYDEVGTRVVATRAAAGIVDEVPVFCLPGSENAAHLGTEEIILPEVGHLVGLAGREQ